jgi:hypothetical protein
MPFNVCGLIRANLYNQDGSLLKNAEDYFFEMDEEGSYWGIISDKMNNHVSKYFPERESGKNVWQTGFGGDESDGLIDFALQTYPPAVPDMEFDIDGIVYIMKFGKPDIE